MTSSLRRALKLLLVAALGACSLVEGTVAGTVGLTFVWEAPPEEPVWIWARVEGSQDGGSASIQASAGPALFEVGQPLDLALAAVPNGAGKVVVVEVREEPSTAARIIAYGQSEAFAVAASEHVDVEVAIALGAPAPEASGASVELSFGGELKAVANAEDVVSATLTTRTEGAIGLVVANDFDFVAARRDLVIGEAEPGFSCTVDGDGVDVCELDGWDLDEGPLAGTGARTIYVKFTDAAGYETAVYTDSVVVDTTLPVVAQVVLEPSIVRAGESLHLTLTASEAIAEGGAELQVAGEGGPTLLGPLFLTPSVVRWTGTAEGAHEGTPWLFEVELEDLAGNESDPQPLVDAQGEAVALHVDATPPALVASTPPDAEALRFGLATTEALAFPFKVEEAWPPAGLPAAVGSCEGSACPVIEVGGVARGLVARQPALDSGEILGFQYKLEPQAESWKPIEAELDLVIRWSDAAGHDVALPLPFTLDVDFVSPSASCSMQPAGRALGAGEAARLSITVSESLAPGSPLVTVEGLDLAEVIEPGPSTIVWVGEPLAAGSGGTATFSVALEDAFGNPTPVACSGELGLDGAPPAVIEGSTLQSAILLADGDVLAGSFTASEPLAEVPEVLVGGAAAEVAHDGGEDWSFTLEVEQALGAGPKGLAITLVDEALNSVVETSAFEPVVFDFAGPGVASGAVALTPDPDNPLSKVEAATVGTRATLVVIADEALDPEAPMVATATLGEVQLVFELAPGGSSSTGATFELLVPEVDADGDPVLDGLYALGVVWSDGAGNEAETTLAGVTLPVDVTAPGLLVDQAAVTYLRSPWGGQAAEELGGFTLPAGPYFALAPSDPLSGVDVLPAATFELTGQEGVAQPSRMEVWSDASSSSPLASFEALSSGAWPRISLSQVDLPTVWVSGIDAAGNTSERVPLEAVEWVASSKSTLLGASPHPMQNTTEAWRGLEPEAPTAQLVDLEDGAARASASARWIEVPRGAPWPGARHGAVMVHDPIRNVVTLFGGAVAGYWDPASLSDQWEWDGRRWTERDLALSPSARTAAAACWDGWRGRTLLFGGRLVSGVVESWMDELWEWDGESWEQQLPSLAEPWPIGLSGPAFVFDGRRGKAVLYGGFSADLGHQGRLWEWDGESWAMVDASGEPGVRVGMAGTWDPLSERVLLLGGSDGEQKYADLWAWDGEVWEELTWTGLSPAARAYGTLTWDPSRDRAVLSGGFGADGVALGDLWEWTGSAWTAGHPARAAAPGLGSAMGTFDGASGQVMLFGGIEHQDAIEPEPTGAFWLYDGEVGTVAGPWDAEPGERGWFHAIWEPESRSTLVHGGCRLFLPGEPATWGDTWSFNGWRWTKAGEGPLRCDAQAAWHEASESWVLVGGLVANVDGKLYYPPTADTWVWEAGAWTAMGIPDPGIGVRYSGAATDTAGGAVLAFGGTSSSGGDEALWSWDGEDWEALDWTGVGPSARRLPLVAWDRVAGELVVAGGADFELDVPEWGLADTWTWDGMGWTEHASGSLAPPSGIMDSQAGWHDDLEAVISVGGIHGTNELASMTPWVWRRESRTWEELSPLLPGGPQQRDRGEWVWDEHREAGYLLGGISNQGQEVDIWELRAGGERAPALQLDVNLAGQPFEAGDVERVRIRTRCGGRFRPYGTDDVGTTLYAWRTGGPGSREGWTELAANDAAAEAPEELSADLDEAAAFANLERTRDRRMAFQVRPSGVVGAIPAPPAEPAEVRCERFEVRIRYQASP